MALLTAVQVADAWVTAGGPKHRATEWVAIAMGESSLRTDARSSADARGLWQIMPFNFAPNGVDINHWQDPVANALVAVRMSGRGTNCAAWDSCYRDIEASGRYTFLAWPEQGSADFNNLAIAGAALGTHAIGGSVPPPEPVIGGDAARALARLHIITGKMIPSFGRQLIRQRMLMNRQWTDGWR